MSSDPLKAFQDLATAVTSASDAATRSAFGLGALWATEMRGGDYTVEDIDLATEAAVRFKSVPIPAGANRIEYRDGEFHFARREPTPPATPPTKRSWITRLLNRLF